MTTIDIANEKGSISDAHGIIDETHHGGGGGKGVPSLSAHTYVHNTTPQLRAIANPGPLGLFAFATTIFTLSMYNMQAHGVTVPNAVIGMSCFVGGLAQFAAGMWDFVTGNVFGATAFSVYGGFWLAYSALLYPGSGVAAAYAQVPGQLNNAIGIFLVAWIILTFIFLLGTLRTNVVSVLVFSLLEVTFLLLMIGEFSGSITITKMGGGAGLSTGLAAFYAGAAQLLTEDNCWFTLPVGPIPRRRPD